MNEQIEKVRLFRPLWAGATASTSRNTGAAGRMLTADRSAAWYSHYAGEIEVGTLPDQMLTVDWDGMQVINSLVIDRHNLSDSSSVRHRLYSGDDEVFDSGVIQTGHPIAAGDWIAGVNFIGECYDGQMSVRTHNYFLAAPVFADRWEIDIVDPDNPDGYLRIERLPVGHARALDNNFGWRGELRYRDKTKFYDPAGGGLVVERGHRSRELAVSFGHLTARDRSWLHVQLAETKADLWFVAAYPSLGAAGGIEAMAHQFLAYRTEDLKAARLNVLFGGEAITLREA
ncbi:MAG: hypothetical protein OIF57_19825 [Marinobacterium sp.]|nr:hypothetical protein [Marinobacterium sp.]